MTNGFELWLFTPLDTHCPLPPEEPRHRQGARGLIFINPPRRTGKGPHHRRAARGQGARRSQRLGGARGGDCSGIERGHTQQIEGLIRGGAPGVHFYTLNKAHSTVQILKNLGHA